MPIHACDFWRAKIRAILLMSGRALSRRELMEALREYVPNELDQELSLVESVIWQMLADNELIFTENRRLVVANV